MSSITASLKKKVKPATITNLFLEKRQLWTAFLLLYVITLHAVFVPLPKAVAASTNKLPKVLPAIDCVKNNANGSSTTWFGYENPGPATVVIPSGDDNKLAHAADNQKEITTFLPGKQKYVFSTTSIDSPSSWILNDTNVTATLGNSVQCPDVAVEISSQTPGTSSFGFSANVSGKAYSLSSNQNAISHVYVNGAEAKYNPEDNGWTALNVPVDSKNKEVVVKAVDKNGKVASTTTNESNGSATQTNGTLVSVDPATAIQGQSLQVTLHGNNTRWIQGKAFAAFGEGISVQGAAEGQFGTLTVLDNVTARVIIDIAPTATLAPRLVYVQTRTPLINTISLQNAFTVTAPTAPGSASTNVSTIAGGAGAGYADGIGSAAKFNNLAGVTIALDDTIFVADAGNNRIRFVRREVLPDNSTQWVTRTLAGDGTAGFQDGDAAQARFSNPQGVAVDASGNVYVADAGNHRIRKITSFGTVSTVAGDGTPGYVNGAAMTARFSNPRGVAADNQGNVYIADTGNSSVRKLDLNGTVSTVAGDGTVGSADSPNSRFNGLAGVAVDGANIYVYLADTNNHKIRRLDASGFVTTLAGSSKGFVDGGAATARFADPSGVAIDALGRVVVADTSNSLVRLVIPATGGSSSSNVSTLAGTGERGLVNGSGNAARFFTPRGVAVSRSSAIIIADTGNHALRRIGVRPVISSINPASARRRAAVVINGEGFDGRSTQGDTVKFAKIGGGQTTALVTAATPTQLTVTVPADAVTGPVTVTTADGTGNSPANFTVQADPTPVIADFSPRRGKVGDTINLTGNWLQADSGQTTVTFAGPGNVRLPALVSATSQTQVSVMVPNGAASGNIVLTNAWGTAQTPQPFVVDEAQQFQVTVAPTSVQAIERASGTAVISLTSTNTTFTQLARLSATGLPAGVAATFEPQQITAGSTSTLHLSLQNAAISTGSFPFTITATANVTGRDVVNQANATLSVTPAGQTTLTGRVLNTDNEPLLGATVSLDGRTVTTDASGSFTLSGVTAGPARPLQIDGRTISAANRTYPVITEPASIVAGQANQVPYTFFLPPIAVQHEVPIVPGQTTVVTNPDILNLQMTVPPDANLTNRDGTPVMRVSVTPLEIDRTPTPLPPNVRAGMVYTAQPGGAISSAPIPVSYPNLLGTEPGTVVNLYAFDHDNVRWYIYGTGKVSNDGKTIVPEINPATGRPYGLTNFSWYFPDSGPGDDPGGGPGGKRKGGGRRDGGDGDCPDANRGSHPVDFSTGTKIETATDVYIEGGRGNLEVTRTYTNNLATSCDYCPFGGGTTFNYAIRLTGTFQTGGAGRLVMPEEKTGQLFSYVRTEGDGSLLFAATGKLALLGDTLRKLTDGTFEYRSVDGSSMRFNAQGRLTAEVDLNGNTTTLNYVGTQLSRVTDAVGRSLNFQYDSSSRITQINDPLNRVWAYTYDGTSGTAGLKTVTDPEGNVTRYEYNLRTQLTSITAPKGNLVKNITYNNQGRVTSQQFADNGTESYGYGLTGSVVTQTLITDPLGRKTLKRFNASGYVIESTDPLGQKAVIERNLTNNLATSTSGSCGCTEESKIYDDRGNILSKTDREGKTTTVEYNQNVNSPTKITDSLGRDSLITYDQRGNATSFTNSLNQTTSLTINSYGQITSITNALGHVSRMEYDPNGNLSASIDPLNKRTTFEYDAVGRRTAIIDPLGRRTTATYDLADRIANFTDPSGAVTTYEYDANSNVTKVTDALGRSWQTSYDLKDRPISAVDPLGRKMRYRYNLGDEVTSVLTPEGRTIKYAYDDRGHVSKVTDPLNNEVNYAYDFKGNVASIRDQRGNLTTFVYDALYRPVAKTNSLGQTESVRYNELSQIVEATDALGRSRNTTYDFMGRVASTIFADAQTSYAYDAAGRVTQISDSQGGNVSRTYDDAGRVLSETTPAGTVSYTYNDAGQRISMTAGSRAPVTYTYDTAGRLEKIIQNAEQFIYSYDPLSRVRGLARPNSVATTYSYDNVGRLERLKHTGGGGQAIEDYRYSYTLDDQISGITSLLPANNLPDAKTYGVADASNRIRQIGAASYNYDEQGQITAKTTQQGTTQYNWDARGRLTQATLPDGQTVGYAYDAVGRLAKRTINNQNTTYLYDGANIVADQNSDGSTIEYLNGGGIDNKLRQSTAATGALYFQTDHLGSTTALTNSSGGVVERQSYTPFGANTSGSATRFGYTGRERDAATGLLYYRARWYDAEQGRFMSEDPLGFGGGMNFYVYAGNNPIGFKDPMGTSIVTFTQGLWDGATEGLFWKIAVGIGISVLLECVTGGAATVLAAALAAWLGYAIYQQAMELAELIVDLLQNSECPDVMHYRIGHMLGQFIGDLLAGELARATKFCFVAGTLVHTRDGLKKIEDVKAGDEVLSYNEQTKRNEYQQVFQTFINYSSDILNVQIAGESEALGVTVGHPFFVKIRGARDSLSTDDDEPVGVWLRADELTNGDQVKLASGRWVRVEQIEQRAGGESVYNFEVANNHDYFVGQQGALVHNAKCGPKTDPNAPHNKKITDTAAQVEDGIVIAGGGGKERLIPTPGGYKNGRRPDILVERPDGSQYGINVGKQAATGAPVKREAQALSDLERVMPMHFVPYN